MKRILMAVLMLAVSLGVRAGTVADIAVPDSAQVANTDLVLNGAGLRTYSIFGVKIYVGALYLPQKSSDPQAVLAHAGPDRILMHMIHAVSKDQFSDNWLDDFKANNPDSFDAVHDRLLQFIAYFGDSVKDDVITMDYLPGVGTQVSWNGTVRGSIPGEDFHKALLNCYMGPKPPTKDLQAGMLGKSKD